METHGTFTRTQEDTRGRRDQVTCRCRLCGDFRGGWWYTRNVRRQHCRSRCGHRQGFGSREACCTHRRGEPCHTNRRGWGLSELWHGEAEETGTNILRRTKASS